jgi:hypothetical protein
MRCESCDAMGKKHEMHIFRKSPFSVSALGWAIVSGGVVRFYVVMYISVRVCSLVHKMTCGQE